ncbi:lycopene cyclase family protein [Pseudonocardia endophytica]|uniref:Lycopene beta-cyclase n=1 Tax=Pseudonocardia endophytica TaxID=401976 RepID=A0A4R1HPY0_PSEEN|nr:lycopene cyclase family protein [Pseudonocardia endophytica]TCK22745.1 lycopene beta-cyclase [Pseudonocardia endophytica]
MSRSGTTDRGRPVRIVVAGSGLAGSCVVVQLAARVRRPISVLVVDDGSRPVDDAAWAFWARGPHTLDPAVSARFDRLRVCAGGRDRVLDLDGYRYRRMRGADLRGLVESATAGDDRFAFRTGHVERIEDRPDGVAVHVDGEAVPADWVLDSVLGPPDPPPLDARLAFHGLYVRTADPVFDPSTPTLLDFRTPQVDGASFVYVLPDGPRRALVEHTTFLAPEATAPDPDRSAAAVAAYLHDVLGCREHVVERVERATLPLRSRPTRRRRGRVLTVGERGGLVKAATGYACDRIQRDAAAIAASVARHGHPLDVPGPDRRHRLLDGALLGSLRDDPGLWERTVDALLDGTRTATALAFLDEDTTPIEEVSLFAGLPAGRLVRALARRQGR